MGTDIKMLLSRSFGLLGHYFVVQVQCADDGKWDWTSNNGDTHTDYASIATFRRPSVDAQGYRLTVGPIALLMLASGVDLEM